MTKILLVDDDLDFVKVTSTILKEKGYNVLEAHDPIQAVAKAYQENPDIILLDVKMPAGDGIEVFKKLKGSTITKETPVVFISGYADDRMQQEAMDIGAKDFLTKPFDPPKLIESIEKALKK